MSLCELVSFQSVELPAVRYGVVYIVKSPLLPLDVASSLSSGVGYLFESFWSIWLKTAQHLVVNFVVFMREDELQSFSSTILIASPDTTVDTCV